MQHTIIISSTSFLVSFLMFPVFIHFFKKRNFLDKPGGRKIHAMSTPAMGGIPIFIGLCASLLMWSSFDLLLENRLVLGATTILFLLGFRDDLINLKALQKLIIQVFAAVIVVVVADIRFTSLYGLFGIETLHIAFSYLISVFTIIVITNAYNLIDGIDGLSGAIGLVSSFFFGIWFFLHSEMALSAISLALGGSLLAFLNFNWAPAKVFMGDTGSLFIGFFLSIAAIAFIDMNYTLRGTEFAFGGSVGTALAILIIPLGDTLKVFIKRLAKGKSPMLPDRTHTHHILLRLGCNHAQATGILLTVNIIFVLLALVLRNLSDAILIPVMVFTALALSTILDFIFRASIEQRKEELREENRARKTKAKVVYFEKHAG